MELNFVQLVPPLVENHSGALLPPAQLPEKLVMTTFMVSAGLRATLGSVPPMVSVSLKFATVLLTAGSAINTTPKAPATPGRTLEAVRSAAVARREGWVRSGGKLDTAGEVALLLPDESSGLGGPASAPAVVRTPPSPTTSATAVETRNERMAVPPRVSMSGWAEPRNGEER